MNYDLIREIAVRAELDMCGCGCDMPTRQSTMFAKLIVKECANFLKDVLDDHFAAEQLAEHFETK
jgi:hypothetical protein